MHRTRDDSAHAGNEPRVVAHGDDAGRSANDVHHVASSRARAHRIPMRVESADRDGNARAQPEFARPLWHKVSGDFVARRVAAIEFRANTGQQWIDRDQKILRRQPAERRAPHPFVAHGANRALHFCGIADPAENRRDHVAMFERGRKTRAFFGIVAQPMQQLRKSPLRGINSAAPVDGLEFFAARGLGDQRRFAPGAVVAPQVILIEGLKFFADRNHA